MGLNYRPLVSADTWVLQVLARTPYADCRDLIALTGRHSRFVEEAVERLHTHRLVRFVWYANADGRWVRRWFVTSWGVIYLSMLDGADLETVVAGNPVTLWWQRRLIERLDSVSSVYRVLQSAAATGVEDTVRWDWFREGLIEGVMTVGDGRLFAVATLGRTANADDHAQTIRQIDYLQRVKDYPDVLVLAPGELEAQRVVADCRSEATRVLVAANEVLLGKRYEEPVWKRYGADAQTTADVLDNYGDRGSIAAGFDYGSLDDVLASEMPRLILPPEAMVASELPAIARRLLHLLYDWPLIRTDSLAGLTGVAPEETKAGLDELMGLGLVDAVRIGKKTGGRRFALSVKGLTRLAWLDGTDSRNLIRSWAIGEDAKGRLAVGKKGRLMAGTDMRYTFNNLGRIDNVHRVLSLMKKELRRHGGWQTVQALPGHRWNRRLKGSERVFSPYATMQVSHQGRQHRLFIDVDVARTVTPRFQRRLDAYQNYLQSDAAIGDFEGEGAAMLVVLPDSAAVDRFSDVVARKFRQSIPLFAASWDTLRSAGPLEKVWRNPWAQYIRHLSLSEVCYGMRRRDVRRLAPQR